MKKLAILITHYQEPETTIKPLLDSIAIQQGIDFNNIEVIIGHDGLDCNLPEEFISSYNFPIQNIQFPHRDLAGTRQNLLDRTECDYVMFCDCDDMFYMNTALYTILAIINGQKEIDALVPDFLEEGILDNGQHVFIPHSKDTVFVHGKVYRRQFLIDNHIKWHQSLGRHQDSSFNVLALTLAADKKAFYTQPLYLWKWNPNSITRRSNLHLVTSWPDMIKSYDACITDFLVRGIFDRAASYAYWCLSASYQAMMHTWWQEADTKEQDDIIYLALKNFYQKYELLIAKVSEEARKKIDEINVELAKNKGPSTYPITIDEWLEKNVINFV